MKTLSFLVLMAAVCAAPAAAAAEDGAALKELLASKSPLIVTVKFVLKFDLRGQTRESNQETLGCVVDESGLVMLHSASLGGTRRMGRGMEIKTTPSDFKIIFGNETEEYEAVLAGKDSKLNLGFIQAKDLKGKKIQALKFADSPEPQIGDQLTGFLRFGRGFDYAPHFAFTTVSGEIKMPRQMWAVSGAFSGLGLPLFDKSGRAVGVMTNQDASGDSDDEERGMDRMLGGLLGGGGLGGGDAGAFLIPGKTVASTVELAKKQASEALQKAKEEGGEKPGDGEKDKEKDKPGDEEQAKKPDGREPERAASR